LHRRHANAAGGGMDQHSVTLRHPAQVMQGVVRGQKGNGNGRGFFGSEEGGLRKHKIGFCCNVVRKTIGSNGDNFVPDL